MQQSVRSLEKSVGGIEGSLRNPNLTPEARSQLTNALQRAQSTLTRMQQTLNGS